MRRVLRNGDIFNGAKTVDKITRNAIAAYPDKPCFGAREVNTRNSLFLFIAMYFSRTIVYLS